MKQLAIIILLFCSIHTYGQSKTSWLKEADKYYNSADFFSALKYYKKILNDSVILSAQVLPYETVVSTQKLNKKNVKIDSNTTISINEYIHHQIGMCYHFTYDYSHAEPHLKTAVDSGSIESDKYYYGVSLMKNSKHDEAIKIFESFIKSNKGSAQLLKMAKSDLTGAYYKAYSKLKTEITVSLADTNVFNKGTSSFGTMWWGSEKKMIFSSARKGGVIIDPLEQNSEFLLDLYWTEIIDSSEWGLPHNFGRPLNSAKHDASGSFNKNNVIFYTRWSDEGKNEKNIYLARGIDLKFFESYKLDSIVNVPGYKSINPHVSMDGTTLFFSSNRPGGEGGMDIWKVRIDKFGNPLNKARNLGPMVNSKFDEVTPFFHETTSTLFFSSNGHKSIGGLDIFKCSYDRDTKSYSGPINLGEPINSPRDDSYMIWDNYLKKGFFSSDRAKCANGHCFDIYEVKNEPIRIMIEGLSFDAVSNDVLSNVKITFKDVEFNFEPFSIYTDESGFYELELSQDVEIFMKGTKLGYFADAASISTKGVTETTTFTQDFFLRNIGGDEIEIKGIEYDYDSHKLRKSSLVELDLLIDFLELNDNLIVQINSHTDYRGNDDYNMDLSNRRAKSCVDYLVNKGIPKERLQAKGFGESTPTHLRDSKEYPILDSKGNRIILAPEYIDNTDDNSKKEEYHQRNRRTAFKVIGEGFNIESK